MRLIILFIFGLISIASFSQVPNCNAPAPYKDEATHILQHIDKTQIPKQTLYEEVFPWADIDLFTGSSNTDTTNMLHFFQAYSELFYASYNQANYTHPLDYETAVKNFNADKRYHHGMGIIDFDFNTIDPNAVNNGLFTVSNGQLYDNPNRSSSPYLNKRAFLSTVLQAHEYDAFYDGTHYFHFQPSLVLSNRSFQLSNIQYIDFYLDGSFMSRAYPNGSNYLTIAQYFPPSDAESILSVVYHTTSNTDEVARIKLKRKILKNFTNCDGGTQIAITGDIFDGGYGEPAYGAQGKGYVFFADNNCTNQVVKKPIIFVDGFDPTNGRNAWDIWSTRINAQIQDNNQNLIRFGDELRSMGYDIIIYDYDEDAVNRGGAGFIENNGIAFAKFLETVRSQYQSTIEEDFVVIAPSMAALVVRYGLAWAEQNNKQHHVRLYLSFDGPQQGAHVTVGIQQTLDQFTQYGGLKVFDGAKNGIHQSNAAKQMLLNHSSQENESIQAHPYRQQFLANLASVGSYPQNLRKIAICDGNRNGILKSSAVQGYEPCDDILRLKIKKRLSPICFNCNKLSIETFAQTDGSRCKTLEMKVNNQANILKFLVGATTDDSFTFYSEPVYTNKSFDKAPGAMFGTEADFDIKWWQSAVGWIFTGQVKLEQNLMPKSNFVPTVSSADYTFPNNENYNIYKSFTGINLSKCAGTTPFDTVYALNNDFNHARIDGGLLEVFRDEIYNPKSSSNCGVGGCPEYVNLTSAPTTTEYKASKAICLLPNFVAENGTVFRADIGCNSSNATINLTGFLPKTSSQVNLLSTSCPFNWDTSKNQIICGAGFTTFKVFVQNIDINTYAEFSTDGFSWFRANLGDKGRSITINANPGQTQVFFARAKNNPSNVIQGWLQHCP